MSWTKDAPAAVVKLLGLAELLGAVGLIVPQLTGIAPVLTPIAAAGLLLILLGALATKLRHHDSPALPVVAMLLAVVIAVGRAHV
jgi:predicted PurR-regulated permease PerM